MEERGGANVTIYCYAAISCKIDHVLLQIAHAFFLLQIF